jgi:hypothetical protein
MHLNLITDSLRSIIHRAIFPKIFDRKIATSKIFLLSSCKKPNFFFLQFFDFGRKSFWLVHLKKFSYKGIFENG